MSFSFLCRTCGETHTGMPSFGADAPWLLEQMAPAEREARCQRDSDACIVDEEYCFVRATIDGLMKVNTPAEIAAKRGKSVEDILG